LSLFRFATIARPWDFAVPRKSWRSLPLWGDGDLGLGFKPWEIIADKFSKAGWSWGCVSAIDSNRRTIWIADAHRDDGKRFVVRADEKLTAFMELESVIANQNPAKAA
jgi:hypothetical protein